MYHNEQQSGPMSSTTHKVVEPKNNVHATNESSQNISTFSQVDTNLVSHLSNNNESPRFIQSNLNQNQKDKQPMFSSTFNSQATMPTANESSSQDFVNALLGSVLTPETTKLANVQNDFIGKQPGKKLRNLQVPPTFKQFADGNSNDRRKSKQIARDFEDKCCIRMNPFIAPGSKHLIFVPFEATKPGEYFSEARDLFLAWTNTRKSGLVNSISNDLSNYVFFNTDLVPVLSNSYLGSRSYLLITPTVKFDKKLKTNYIYYEILDAAVSICPTKQQENYLCVDYAVVNSSKHYQKPPPASQNDIPSHFNLIFNDPSSLCSKSMKTSWISELEQPRLMDALKDVKLTKNDEGNQTGSLFIENDFVKLKKNDDVSSELSELSPEVKAATLITSESQQKQDDQSSSSSVVENDDVESIGSSASQQSQGSSVSTYDSLIMSPMTNLLFISFFYSFFTLFPSIVGDWRLYVNQSHQQHNIKITLSKKTISKTTIQSVSTQDQQLSNVAFLTYFLSNKEMKQEFLRLVFPAIDEKSRNKVIIRLFAGIIPEGINFKIASDDSKDCFIHKVGPVTTIIPKGPGGGFKVFSTKIPQAGNFYGNDNPNFKHVPLHEIDDLSKSQMQRFLNGELTINDAISEWQRTPGSRERDMIMQQLQFIKDHPIVAVWNNDYQTTPPDQVGEIIDTVAKPLGLSKVAKTLTRVRPLEALEKTIDLASSVVANRAPIAESILESELDDAPIDEDAYTLKPGNVQPGSVTHLSTFNNKFIASPDEGDFFTQKVGSLVMRIPKLRGGSSQVRMDAFNSVLTDAQVYPMTSESGPNYLSDITSSQLEDKKVIDFLPSEAPSEFINQKISEYKDSLPLMETDDLVTAQYQLSAVTNQSYNFEDLTDISLTHVPKDDSSSDLYLLPNQFCSIIPDKAAYDSGVLGLPYEVPSDKIFSQFLPFAANAQATPTSPQLTEGRITEVVKNFLNVFVPITTWLGNSASGPTLYDAMLIELSKNLGMFSMLSSGLKFNALSMLYTRNIIPNESVGIGFSAVGNYTRTSDPYLSPPQLAAANWCFFRMPGQPAGSFACYQTREAIPTNRKNFKTFMINTAFLQYLPILVLMISPWPWADCLVNLKLKNYVTQYDCKGYVVAFLNPIVGHADFNILLQEPGTSDIAGIVVGPTNAGALIANAVVPNGTVISPAEYLASWFQNAPNEPGYSYNRFNASQYDYNIGGIPLCALSRISRYWEPIHKYFRMPYVKGDGVGPLATTTYCRSLADVVARFSFFDIFGHKLSVFPTGQYDSRLSATNICSMYPLDDVTFNKLAAQTSYLTENSEIDWKSLGFSLSIDFAWVRPCLLARCYATAMSVSYKQLGFTTLATNTPNNNSEAGRTISKVLSIVQYNDSIKSSPIANNFITWFKHLFGRTLPIDPLSFTPIASMVWRDYSVVTVSDEALEDVFYCVAGVIDSPTMASCTKRLPPDFLYPLRQQRLKVDKEHIILKTMNNIDEQTYSLPSNITNSDIKRLPDGHSIECEKLMIFNRDLSQDLYLWMCNYSIYLNAGFMMTFPFCTYFSNRYKHTALGVPAINKAHYDFFSNTVLRMVFNTSVRLYDYIERQSIPVDSLALARHNTLVTATPIYDSTLVLGTDSAFLDKFFPVIGPNQRAPFEILKDKGQGASNASN